MVYKGMFNGMDIIKYLKERQGISLNSQQQQALLNTQGNVLLLAVPGAGKTTVLVGRIANLILNHGIPPQKILCFTFSRASAKDMGKRFTALFGELIPTPPRFMTIHRFCNQVLADYACRRGGQFILIEDGKKGQPDKQKLLRELYYKYNQEYLQEDMAEELSTAISYIKNMMLADAQIADFNDDIPHLEDIYQEYRRLKKENAWIDFDDMLTLTHTILNKFPDLLAHYQSCWDYIHVDEAQDNSKVQSEIIHLLAKGCGNLFMVGDEDQSVYGFRGAYPEGLLKFQQDYPNGIILKMEENFRSTGLLVERANQFISLNKNRYEKKMFTQREKGEPIQLLEADDLTDSYGKVCRLLAQPFSGTTAVIYRHNHSAIPLLDLLERSGVPFSIREHRSSFRHSYIVGDILAFFALSYNGNDSKALQRIGCKTNAYLKRHVLYHLTPDKSYDSLLDKLIDQSTEEMNLNTGKLKYINRQIKALHTMPPLRAIECILYDIGYMDFIQNCFKAQTAAGHLQKLQALMAVAMQTKTVPQLLDRLEHLEQLISQAPAGEAVTLTTAHSAKGLEFDRVILIDLIDSVFPSVGAVNESLAGEDCTLMEEEARLFYVAVTRAKNRLILVQCSNSGGPLGILPSRFIHRLLSDGQRITKPTVGMTICHTTYGKGIITELNLERDRVTIRFKDNILRTYLASYLSKPEIFTWLQ